MLGQNFLAEFSFLIVEKYLSNEKSKFTEIHITLRESAWDWRKSFLLLVNFKFHFEKAPRIRSNVNTQVATGNVIVKAETINVWHLHERVFSNTPVRPVVSQYLPTYI